MPHFEIWVTVCQKVKEIRELFRRSVYDPNHVLSRTIFFGEQELSECK
jgi:hypothetical protein